MVELGCAGRCSEVLDVAHQQPDVGVGDLFDRDRQRGAVPDIARDPGEELLGGLFDASISAMLFGGPPPRPSFSTSVRVRAPCARGQSRSMAAEHARDQLDEPPVARLDGVAARAPLGRGRLASVDLGRVGWSAGT